MKNIPHITVHIRMKHSIIICTGMRARCFDTGQDAKKGTSVCLRSSGRTGRSVQNMTYKTRSCRSYWHPVLCSHFDDEDAVHCQPGPPSPAGHGNWGRSLLPIILPHLQFFFSYMSSNLQEDRYVSERQQCYVPGQCQVCPHNTFSKFHEVFKKHLHFRNILSTFKKLLMSTSATSFVGKTRTAIGGPLSQSRLSASCSKIALNQVVNQVDQIQHHVRIASVVNVCESVT